MQDFNEKRKKEDIRPFVFHSEEFPVGMTEDEAYEKGSNIFMDYPSVYKRLNYVDDGKLTKEELLYGAQEDKDNGKKCACISGISASLCAILIRLLKNNSIKLFEPFAKQVKYPALGLAAFFTAATVYGFLTMYKANQIIKHYNT